MLVPMPADSTMAPTREEEVAEASARDGMSRSGTGNHHA
jgi:hypothetical protein